MTDSQTRSTFANARSGWDRVADYALADVVALVWRERLLALGVAAVVSLLGLVAVLQIPKSFQAYGQVLVLVDESYVLDPLDTERRNSQVGLSPSEMIQSERALVLAEPVRRAALATLGLEVVEPRIAAQSGPTDTPARKEALAVRAMGKALGAYVSPESPTVTLSYKHRDPDVSAQILNEILDTYLRYRREILLSVDTDAVGRERVRAQEALAAINTELATLMAEIEVGDFDADRAAVNAQVAEMDTALMRTRAERAEAEARVGALGARAAATPAQIALHTDDATPARLQELLLEREDLLTRYLPTSRVVQAHDEKIARLTASYGAGDVDGGLTRRGVNPVRQALEADRDAALATLAALRSREATLVGQVAALRERQRVLQEALPRFARLERERRALEGSVGVVTEREVRAQARRALTQEASDNIRVIERARPPTRGSSLRKPAFAAVLMLAGLLGLAAALVRGLTRSTPPSAAAVGRVLGAPVLAVVSPSAVRSALGGER